EGDFSGESGFMTDKITGGEGFECCEGWKDASCIRIVRKNGKTTLHTVARYGKTTMLKLLIERDSGIIPINDKKGSDRTLYGCERADYRSGGRFIGSNHSTLNERDKKGSTTIHMATRKCRSQGIVISNWEAVDPFHVPYGSHYRSDVLSAVSARVDMVMAPFRSHLFLEDLGYLVESGEIADKRGVLFRCDTAQISGLIAGLIAAKAALLKEKSNTNLRVMGVATNAQAHAAQ
ncbi:ankyrin repeat-containing protein, partial [Tanacetum coccineum]